MTTLDSTNPGRVLPFLSKTGLTFGIYHGGVVESHSALATGKPDQPDEVNRALDHLQSGKHLLVRTYLRFLGDDCGDDWQALPSAADLARYTWNGRKLDLVLSNWDCRGNMAHWAHFIEQAVERYGDYTQCLQICEEPNLYDYPGDGRFQHGVEAVIVGVKTARAKVLELGLPIAVGFNSVPSFNIVDTFWPQLAQMIDDDFLNSLDYVGLNLYVDVAEPVRGKVEDAVEEILVRFRQETLAKARIPGSIPIHICETGWPTGPQRFYTKQAEVVEQIVRKIYEIRSRVNINGFGLFSLRDADTANPGSNGQFGIMRDDYSPKPAFEKYRQLIQELGN
jgi:hypothetical protein